LQHQHEGIAKLLKDKGVDTVERGGEKGKTAFLKRNKCIIKPAGKHCWFLFFNSLLRFNFGLRSKWLFLFE